MSAMLDFVDRSRAEKPILPLLLAVLEDFHEQSISYCYWKSSRRIYSVLTGEADLDLLVAREDQHRTEAALLRRGLKRFPSVAHRDHPAISSFLGHDEWSGRLVHIHLHFRLVVGEPLLKNYSIPWEQTILARAAFHPALPIRMLDPTSEALLLAVRACLELRRPDPIALRHARTAANKFELDRAALAVRIERGTLHGLATELLTADLALPVADAIFGTLPLERQNLLRRRMRRYLAPYRTYNAMEARLRSLGRSIAVFAGRLNKDFLQWPRPWSKRAPNGGRVVAVIGVDGSGKSTVVASIRSWLAAEVDVLPVYFGTGDGRPSLVLRPFKLMVPLITAVMKTKPKGASHGRISDGPPSLGYSVLLAVWAIMVAVEKRFKLLAARRGASRGLIVLTDRYPQNEIVGFNDGPLLSRLARVPRWLRSLETRTYALARRLPPDLVIKLDVTPATAARREPAMDLAVIERRIAEVKRLKFSGARVVRVDAEQPLDDVIRAVKREVWSLL
jgi:thymidylate kinase